MTGNSTLNVQNAVFAEFVGGFGETFGSFALTKQGSGFLVFSAPATYSGATTLATGSYILRGAGTALNTSFTVDNGATLRLDNDFGLNLTNRLGDTAAITLNGGEFIFVGKVGAVSTEQVGVITANVGVNSTSTILSQTSPQAGSQAILTAGGLTPGAAANVNFGGLGVPLGTTSANQIRFVTAPALTSGILPYATLTGSTDFVTHTGASTSITSAATVATLTAGANVKLAGGVHTLTANLTVNALMLLNGATLNTAGFILTVTTGQVIGVGTGNAITGTGTLAFAAVAPLFFTESNVIPSLTPLNTTLTISAKITGTGIMRKYRSGKLVLSGDNIGFTVVIG
jgi:fibronectin-binding autotransporter adhesin